MAKKEKEKKKGSCLKTLLIILGVFVVLGIVGSALGGDGEDKKVAGKNIEESPAETPAPTDTEEEDTSVPKEHRSALKKAKAYSDTMNMSKQSIYEQLISEYGERFSEEAAQYAMDNLQADWNANALEKAKDYSETMHMSKQGIYDQLTSEHGEKFTQEEAQYAIDNVQVDWNANALEKAKDYQDTMDMSPEAIRDQLTSEYGEKFTQEEADYAISNLN